MNYTGQINWGDWQQMPDYRAGSVNKHKSGITELGRALDPMTYVPGIKEVANPIHDAIGQGTTYLNQALSPVVKALHQIEPTYHLNRNNFIGRIHDFTETKPVDALGVAAATYFTAGAASGLAGGASAAPAASGGAGAAGGMAGAGTAAANSAITPAFASGAAGGAGVTAGAGAGAITPAFGAAGLSISPAAVSGGLGAAGTAAANALLTPAFASWGGGGAGLLGSLKGVASKADQINNYRSNIQKFANADTTPTERQIYNQQAGDLAGRIINSTPQPAITPRQRVAQQMTMNRMGRRW